MRWAWLALAAAAALAQEFTFDAAKYDRRPYELTGYVELKHESFALNRDGAFHDLNFPGSARERLDRSTLIFKPSLKLRAGDALTANFRAHLESQHDDLADSRTSRFDEAFVSWKPDPGVTVDAGKVALKWGKAYAWNPVAFVERPKDPNDPELAREGFTLVSADFIRNFDGPLQTIAFTPVIVPVSSDTNPDFGARGHVNVAAKLYLLYRDTDIDFMFLNGGSRSRRYGFDFSRNVGTNLEIHGEWARLQGVQRPVADARGMVRANATSYVLGARYLTERDTTWIVEYYRNGAGYTRTEMNDFYSLVESGARQRAAQLAQGGFGRPNAGGRYLYVRASQKEPFDILYFTPAVTLITNLDDGSASVAPEVTYTGFTNIELRARLLVLGGPSRSDFGEKQNERRLELLARLYF